MTASPFESFIAFIEIDRSLRQVQHERNTLQKELDAIQTEKKHFHDVLVEKENLIKEAQKKVSSFELDIKSQKERQRELERKLEEVANPKEYISLQKEIDGIQTQLKTVEDHLLSAWQDHENAENSKKNEEKGLEAVETKYKSKEESLQKKIQELSGTITQLEEQRIEKEKSAPIDFIERYHEMKQKVDDPVVPVLNNHCSACNYELPRAVIGNLQRNILTACPECFRLLYYPPTRS